MPEVSPSINYSRLKLTSFTRGQVGALRVAIIGCGALGAEAARLLGLLGVGSVLLIDEDRVEPTNLTHSPYLREVASLGRPKAEVLAAALALHFPDTAWAALPREIADVGFGRLQSCALLLSCTDSALARVETCYAARRLQIPMMDAGLKGRSFWAGRVAWFPAGTAACYLCQLSAATRAELLSLALAASQSCSAPIPDSEPLPSTPTMASIVAGLQVDFGVRLLLAPELAPQSCAWELSLPLPETTWASFTIPRSADCPWHDFPETLVPLPPDTLLRKSLTVRKQVLDLDWPLCLQARCATCQHRFAPMTRIATLRRHTLCPACGGARLHSIETLTSVAAADPAARWTPTQLGLPSDHLFTLRKSL